MARIPDDIREFMRTYGVLDDEVWPVPGGKAYAIKHKALERIAMEVKIAFEPPTILEANGPERCAALCVHGYRPNPIKGEAPFTAWSIGEASPANNKNQYPYAMAEKRAKDRVILKLLSCHGSLYSEDEVEDFKQPPAQPQRAAPVTDTTEKTPLTILCATMRLSKTPAELKQWKTDNAVAIEGLNDEDYREVQAAYQETKNELDRRLVEV